MSIRKPVTFIAILALLSFAVPALADGDTGDTGDTADSGGSEPIPDVSDYDDSGFGMDLSAYGLLNFAWHPAIGAGIQFGYPIVPNGFIPNPKFRDALYIEGGFDLNYFWWAGYNWLFFSPLAGVRYSVYVLESFAPFVSLKIGASIPTASDLPANWKDDSVYFFTSGTIGFMWDFASDWALRGEFGWQYHGYNSDVYRIGVTYKF